MKKVLAIVLGGIAAGGVVAAAVFFFVLGGDDASADGAPADEEATPVSVPGKLGPHITLTDRVFTLLSPADAQRYVKLEIVIEFETYDEAWERVLNGCAAEGAASGCQGELDALLAEFEQHEIGTGRRLIEDAVTTIVSARTLAEISTVAGREAMRQEIREVVDELIYEPRVSRVLFTEFLTQ